MSKPEKYGLSVTGKAESFACMIDQTCAWFYGHMGISRAEMASALFCLSYRLMIGKLGDRKKAVMWLHAALDQAVSELPPENFVPATPNKESDGDKTDQPPA